jgi:hypothetical protein
MLYPEINFRNVEVPSSQISAVGTVCLFFGAFSEDGESSGQVIQK